MPQFPANTFQNRTRLNITIPGIINPIFLSGNYCVSTHITNVLLVGVKRHNVREVVPHWHPLPFTSPFRPGQMVSRQNKWPTFSLYTPVFTHCETWDCLFKGAGGRLGYVNDKLSNSIPGSLWFLFLFWLCVIYITQFHCNLVWLAMSRKELRTER